MRHAQQLHLRAPLKVRLRLARSPERLVEQADEQPPPWNRSAVVWPSQARVREARPIMLTMASRLRRDRPVDANAVAALKRLLSDGGGLLYTRGDPEALRSALRVIGRELDGRD